MNSRVLIPRKLVQAKILNFDDLSLPDVYRQVISTSHEGLVLVCGVTGSGKSSTLAAMVDHINHNRGMHIITIEDPIEFEFVGSQSIISQREIGRFMSRCIERDMELIVTTEKDAVRFPRPKEIDVPIYFLWIEVEILRGQEIWDQLIDRLCASCAGGDPLLRLRDAVGT